MDWNRNPRDGKIVEYCADTLQNLYASILRRNQGISRHESTMVMLRNIILKLRKLQNYIR